MTRRAASRADAKDSQTVVTGWSHCNTALPPNATIHEPRGMGSACPGASVILLFAGTESALTSPLGYVDCGGGSKTPGPPILPASDIVLPRLCAIVQAFTRNQQH